MTDSDFVLMEAPPHRRAHRHRGDRHLDLRPGPRRGVMTDSGQDPASGTRQRDGPARSGKDLRWNRHGASAGARGRWRSSGPSSSPRSSTRVAIRGHRRVGKTQLLHKVVRGQPEGRPVVWHTAYGCNTPEAARVNLLDSLEGYSVTGASGKELSKLRGAAASLQSMPDILEHLLRDGVSVAVDWADCMLHDALPSLPVLRFYFAVNTAASP